ncbi:thrombomodulin [Pholidichthys leucotaenia]
MGPCVLLLLLLVGRVRAAEPHGGSCLDRSCFTVFHHPSDFNGARDQCRALGGDLMTVRATVSHQVLPILLRNSSGKFWIGLLLPSGCPDPSARLKGFRWVSRDQSDFENWDPDLVFGCPSQRCAVVSADGSFPWSPEACSRAPAGFLCEHGFSQPCAALPRAPAHTVTYSVPFGFSSEDVPNPPPGTVAVVAPPDTKHICNFGRWQRAPWNCDVHNGGCHHACAVDPNKEVTCYCPRGQTVDPSNGVSCRDMRADHPCAALKCQQLCYGHGDSHACACEQGYKLADDGRSCVDRDDCGDARQCPGERSRCVNTSGGFRCVCEPGYSSVGGACVDEDECISAPCEHVCHNSPGSYACSCDPGYVADPGAAHKCVLHCGLQECRAQCDPNNPHQCYCPDGYVSEERRDAHFCLDVDECASNFCDQGCTNTFGSYVCACHPGFTLVGQYRCVKTDDEDADGSGMTASPGGPTSAPLPEPTRRPSGVSAGGLTGIIVCTVLVTLLLAFLAHRLLTRTHGKAHGARKAADNL